MGLILDFGTCWYNPDEAVFVHTSGIPDEDGNLYYVDICRIWGNRYIFVRNVWKTAFAANALEAFLILTK